MKNRKSQHTQVLYYVYSTHIQANKQDISVQKPTQKGTKIPKTKKKTYTKV